MDHPPTPADTLLAIDVGNTRIGLGVWDQDGLHDVQRVAVAEPESWPGTLSKVWQATRHGKQRRIVLGSVSPQHTDRLVPMIRDVSDQDPFCIRADLPLPMPLDVENPDEVGVDRVCCAAAAYEHIAGACAVASLGTATTIDCVSRTGRFLGGTILPGLELSCDVLHERTALLPHVRPTDPVGPFGRNTRDAIINGVCYAAVGALREIVERFATELREWPQLVVTGGNAPLICRLADFVDSVVPDLCLMGVALTYRKAAGQS
jgi:type III pantothenate kinase